MRYFYWAPALSHIRRELNRLDDLGYVHSREEMQGRVRRTLKYKIAERGSAALREWAEGPDVEPVVVKNSVVLRLWLGRRAGDGHLVLRALEQHIEHVASERDSLADNIKAGDEAHKERMAKFTAADELHTEDARIAVERSAWHLSVMRYCLRQYDHELRSAKRMMAELSALAEHHSTGEPLEDDEDS